MPSYLYVPLIEEREFLIFGMDAGSGKLRLSRQIRLSARPYQLCADPRQRYLYQQLRSESYSIRTVPGRSGSIPPERPFTFPTAATTALPSLPSMAAPDCYRRWVGFPASPFLGPWAFPPTDASFLPAATSPGGCPAFGSMKGVCWSPWRPTRWGSSSPGSFPWRLIEREREQWGRVPEKMSGAFHGDTGQCSKSETTGSSLSMNGWWRRPSACAAP